MFLKLLTLFITMACANFAYANILNWSDLELNKKYKITHDIVLSDKLKLQKGDTFLLEEIESGEVPVMFYTFKNLQCTDAELTSEMILFNPEPEDSTDDKSVGIEQNINCNLSVFVEPRHFYNLSAFAD